MPNTICYHIMKRSRGIHDKSEHGTFERRDGQIWYLGSIVCKPCFIQQIVVPQHGCQRHRPRSCDHMRVDGKCESCIPWSFAGFWYDRVRCLVEPAHPETLSLHTDIIARFRCDVCSHEFNMRVDHVTRQTRPHWCPYCTNQKLCGKPECTHCMVRSLASWSDTRKLACVIMPADTLHTVALHSCKIIRFRCDKCPHEFDSMLYNITDPRKSVWCPYCAGKKLCGKLECNDCWIRSLASWSDTKKLACVIMSSDMLHTVALHSGRVVRFRCDRCSHEFETQICNATAKMGPTWCPYCTGTVCGNDACDICAPCCVICRDGMDVIVKGTFRTTNGFMCRSCYRRSGLAPPNMRAKVSLEIYFLAELQRLSANSDCMDCLWSEPTSWDCPILPGLNFKPDMLWAFDAHGNMFSCAGACKLERVAHVVIVEILEIGVIQHSTARDVSDIDRERQIRGAFPRIPVAFVYVVVAATNHWTSHSDDRFFTKSPDTLEYTIEECRAEAWRSRIFETLSTLQRFRTSQSNETVIIGH